MRTEGDFIHINEWLLPFSFLYGIAVTIRNKLFDWGILKSRTFDIPVISVGNITVGGSGKTPHVEYLVNLLKDKLKIAVLSRGYKRKTRGYQLANDNSTAQEIGDESYQIHKKYPNIYVAVDRKRVEGIEYLTSNEATKDVDAILLDDAFQHRYVTPGINILLVDYHRLIIYDRLLPAGRLRESVSEKHRADMVIITKCPKDLKPMEFRVLTKAMDLYPYQDLYFTTFAYKKPVNIFSGQQIDTLKGRNVLLLTGIASPKQMAFDLKAKCKSLQLMSFKDHHQFSREDIEAINKRFSELPSPKIIITTEKDAARIEPASGLSEEAKESLYALPVYVKFLLNQEDLFNNKITSYVRKNSRNSILAKRKDDNKPDNSNHPGNGVGTISFRNN